MDANALFAEYEDGRREVKEYPLFGFRPLYFPKLTKRRTCKSNFLLPQNKIIQDQEMMERKRNGGGIKRVRIHFDLSRI